LRSLLLVIEIRIENVELIALNCSGWGVIVSVVETVVLVPLHCHSFTVYVLRFSVSESALCLTGNPVVKFFLVFLHAFVLLELYDFLSDVVVGDSRL
jgi:hypothetical protein